MDEWKEATLQEVAYFQEGPGILAKDFSDTGVPLVRLSGLGGYEVTLDGCNFVEPELGNGKWSHFQLKKGDILVSTSASFGRPTVVGNEAEGAIFYTGIIRFRSLSSHLDEKYLRLFLGSSDFMTQAEAMASGSVIRHFGPLHLREMRINLPPLAVQEDIADVVGALDKKIELNRRMNETLETMARAIFKDWFVDFGPTRAKAEGRPPYLAPEIWELFPEDLDDRNKPRGWKPNRIDSLFDISIGRTPPRKEQHHFVPKGGGRTWISIKDMAGVQTFIFSSEEDLTPAAIEAFRVPLISADTVVVSFKLTVGRVAIAAKEMYSNEAIAHLKRTPLTPVEMEYTYCFMSNFDYESLASTSSIATAVNSKSIKAIEMLVPDGRVHSVFSRPRQSDFSPD